MSKDYQRAIHIDFHTMPGIGADINNFDAEAFAKTLFDAHVTYVNVVAECNIGYCYFPTKVGLVYPDLKKDLFGESVKACRKYGIKVTAYLNAGINHAILWEHPEWRRVDEKGCDITPPIVDGEDNYATLFACFNSGYTDYLKSLIKEIITNYEVDGIFCDCFRHVACYCDKCRSVMQVNGIDYTDEKQAKAFTYENYRKFCSEVRQMVAPKHSFFNSMDWNRDFNDHIELESLPNSKIWTYDYFLPYAAFARNCKKEVTYMVGRFQTDWGDFGGICSKASLQNDMYDAISAGFGFCVGDHRNPAGNLIAPLYKMIGDVFAECKEYQKYSGDSVYQAEIGILTSLISDNVWQYMGLCRMLSELKYTYNIIFREDDFSKYKVIVLPNDMLLDNCLAEKLEKYLQNGGRIISCGCGGLNCEKMDFALNDYKSAIEFCSQDERTTSYFRLKEDFCQKYQDIDWATYQPSIKMRVQNAKTLARDVGLFFDKHYDGKFNYLYLPPKEETEYTCVAKTNNFVHFAFDIFKAYGTNYSGVHREMFKEVLNDFLPNPYIKAEELPLSTRVTLTKAEKYSNLNIKVTYPEAKCGTGRIDEHNTLPRGRKICVLGKYEKAVCAHTNEALQIKNVGDYTEITLPEIVGFLMVLLYE
jgi:hypothetical protein